MFCRTIKLQNNHVYKYIHKVMAYNILYRSNFRSFWEEIYKSYFYLHKAEKIMYFEYFKGVRSIARS